MDIYILNGFNIIDVVATYESVIWNMQFFGDSEFELVVPGTPNNINRFAPGYYLVRNEDMSAGEFQNVMVIEGRQLDYDIDKGWVLTLSGRGLKSIIGRRVIWQQTNLNGTVESGIRQVITDNIISPADSNRQIANFILDTEQGYTDTFDVQLLGENIAEWLESITPQYGIGWDVYIKNNQYVFTLKKGTDRTYEQNTVSPVVFSPEFDNLISSTYAYELQEYKNAALVGGEGEGTAQRFATVGTATGLNRYEGFVDGSSVSSNGEIITLDTYLNMLQDYGAEQLNGTAFVEKFEGQVIPNGLYNLNEDYFLGDLIQIENENGISAVSRITEIIYSEDENGWALTPTFGDWEGVDEE